MFEFYQIVAVPGNDEKEIKKLQYEETPENLALKERLQEEVAKYELVEITLMDRYYHICESERTYSLDLSESVFEGESFVGYMSCGSLYLTPENEVLISREVRGATSVQLSKKIRRIS